MNTTASNILLLPTLLNDPDIVQLNGASQPLKLVRGPVTGVLNATQSMAGGGGAPTTAT